MAKGAWIYIPAHDDDDDLLKHGAVFVPYPLELQDDDVPITRPGEDGLANVHNSDPAILVIFGHGNYGNGIGSHKKHFDAKEMVQLLVNDGLSPHQKNLRVYLWACNSGVDMGRVVFAKDSYAKRFATQLAEAGFDNTEVVGFVGFLSGIGAFTVLEGNLHSGKIDAKAAPLSPMDEERQVIFSVNKGNYEKTQGQQWISWTNYFTGTCKIMVA